MDYHFLKQDYPKTAKAVDQLDQQVGGDPYLNLFRANIAIGQNDAEAARGFVETLIKALPDKAPKAMAFCSIRRLRPKTTSKPPAYSRRWRPKPPSVFQLISTKPNPLPTTWHPRIREMEGLQK